jgi:tetratricopeptide (TPR) repeat protein
VISLSAKGDTITVSVTDTESKLELGTKTLKKKDLAKSLGKTVEDITIAKAKAVFGEANQHYSLGEFDKAMDSYSLAYRIKALPAFLFNIAQCHRKLGHYKEAIAMYQNYLTGVPNAPNKDVVDSLIKEAKDRQNEEDARAAEQAKLQHDLEAKRIEAEKKKAEDARKAKEAEARAEEERKQAELARIKHEQETYDKHPSRKWMIATGVLGAVGLGVGGYFAVQERDQQQTFDAAKCGDPTELLSAADLATCRTERDDGQRDATLATSFLIGGGAVVAVAAIVFAIDPGNVERPRTEVSVTAHSIGLAVHW